MSTEQKYWRRDHQSAKKAQVWRNTMKMLVVAATLIFGVSEANAGIYVCLNEAGDRIVLKRAGDAEQFFIRVEKDLYQCTISRGRKCGYGTHSANMLGICPY